VGGGRGDHFSLDALNAPVGVCNGALTEQRLFQPRLDMFVKLLICRR
jgi:hypothetical protein